MKKLTLGIATAALLLTAAAPAMAQVGIYAGPSGLGVQFGGPYGGYNSYPYGGYYDSYTGPVWPGHRVWHGHAHFHGGPHGRR
jgi:hypothetical protein